MSKQLLWGIITVLLITNIASLLLLSKEEKDPIKQVQQKENLPEHVATVGDTKISSKEWFSSLKQQFGEDLLKEMINKEVVFQLAEEHNLEMNENLLNRELARLETATGIMSNETREQNRKKWAENIKYQYYLESLLTKDIVISDSEVSAYYSENKEDFFFPTTFQLSHIIVEDQGVANQIIQELKNGESFAELAKQYSIDEYTKDKGGYLGYFSEDSSYLQSTYFSVLHTMGENTYSEPFQTNDGTVIVYLHHVLPEMELSFDDVKDYIRNTIALQQVSSLPDAKILWSEVGVDWIYEE
jgi:foldase protein PrsA